MITSTRSGWPLPVSAAFEIKDTTDIGRAVFAKADLDDGCRLLSTTSDHSPVAHVILRPYRREVCAWCFSYDRGKEWKLRDAAISAAYCLPQCQRSWQKAHDASCQQAIRTVETFLKGQAKKNTRLPSVQLSDDQAITSNTALDSWRQIENEGNSIRAARTAPQPSKKQRAILRKVTELMPDADILTYVLSGTVCAYNAYKDQGLEDSDGHGASFAACDLLPSLFELAPDDAVFSTTPMTPSPLHDYTSAYLVLLSILPISMLAALDSDLVINLASRASHNAFSIRPEGLTDGDQSGEFLGWGVWPEASFFNHSCTPNIRKQRTGRVWTFEVDANETRTVRQGQQLCITYLGGDERDLDVTERRKRLREQWGFTCCCERCLRESVHS